MAKQSGVVKLALLGGGGYLLYRWFAGRPAAEPATEPATGIISELRAFLDTLQRTATGGVQPGDTNSVQNAAGNGNGNGNGNGEPAPTFREQLLAQATPDAAFSQDGGKLNTYQWNWHLRAVRGIPQTEASPDLPGDPAEFITVDEYLARRSEVGLSGVGQLPQTVAFARWMDSRRRARRPLRRPAYPVWIPRQRGERSCTCGPTACNCYRV